MLDARSSGLTITLPEEAGNHQIERVFFQGSALQNYRSCFENANIGYLVFYELFQILDVGADNVAFPMRDFDSGACVCYFFHALHAYDLRPMIHDVAIQQCTPQAGIVTLALGREELAAAAVSTLSLVACHVTAEFGLAQRRVVRGCTDESHGLRMRESSL